LTILVAAYLSFLAAAFFGFGFAVSLLGALSPSVLTSLLSFGAEPFTDGSSTAAVFFFEISVDYEAVVSFGLIEAPLNVLFSLCFFSWSIIILICLSLSS
jgi:hypothetical protein